MVAPHDTGELLRSLVRVPGSGSNGNAEAVSLDLARVSSLAASVVISHTLPADLQRPRASQDTPQSESPETENLDESLKGKTKMPLKSEPEAAPVTSEPEDDASPSADVTAAGGSRKRQRSDESADDSSENGHSETNGSDGDGATESTSGEPGAKRARLVYMTPQQVASFGNRIIPVSTASGQVFVLPVPQLPQMQPGATAPVVMTQPALVQLMEECNRLRRERQQLQQRLSLFQQLFRNRERLTSVVKRLGVNIG